MNVVVKIKLGIKPKKEHWDVMQEAANALTNDSSSVEIYAPQNEQNTLMAAFTIKRVRQMDVVDRIGKRFSLYMEDYQDSSIAFP